MNGRRGSGAEGRGSDGDRMAVELWELRPAHALFGHVADCHVAGGASSTAGDAKGSGPPGTTQGDARCLMGPAEADAQFAALPCGTTVIVDGLVSTPT